VDETPDRPPAPSIPYRYEPDATAAELAERFAGLEPGTETGQTVTVAGRIMRRRGQGRTTFDTLQDGSGQVQLFARAKVTPDYEGYGALSLGDWVGARGQVMTTRTGELSVSVEEWVLLAEARRRFPDKWHGLTDTDTRYRQRYVDLWVTEEARATFRLRSRLISLTRRFLEDRGYLEVETPILHPIPGGATARPFVTHHNTLDTDLYLRVAPELYLKRLVVGGLEKVYEIGRVFRNEGLSPRHNTEFTMLELYEAYATYDQVMDLTENMIRDVAMQVLGTGAVSWEGQWIDLAPAFRRWSMIDAVLEHNVQIQREDLRDVAKMRAHCERLGIRAKPGMGWGAILLEVFEHTVEHLLVQPTFITDHPTEVSPLARAKDADPELTDRFELFVGGKELANGFSELNDAEDQAARFQAQVAAKEGGNDEAMHFDADYIRALEVGLPPTGGLGVGIDRLVMLLTDSASIRDVLLFPYMRPEA
jgi:lysyl-tRNA synthetase, class II